MRLGGLSSGLDTDTMVKEMMKSHQSKVDKAKQDKVLVEYKQELYRDVMKDMKEIYTKYFDLGATNRESNIISNTNYSTVSFESADSSVVTAKGMAGANAENYSVSVEQMASTSRVSISSDTFKDYKEETMILIIGDTEIEVSLKDKDGNSIIDKPKAIIDNINTAIATYNKEESVKIDLKISYSELSDSIVIEGKKTGKSNNVDMAIKANGDGSSFLNFNFEKAKNAIVNISDSRGNSKKFEKEGNSFTIDNIQYTLHGVSESKNGKFEETKLSGKYDGKGTVENIKRFVNDYNNLMDKVNKLLVEKNNRDYRPLTEEQKKEMSEDEIKIWNLKVKQGLLRSDDILTSMMNELLGHFSTKSGANLNLADIGISLNTDYKGQKGKLVLDEDKLTKALADNGENTRKLLTGTFGKVKDSFNNIAVSSGAKLSKRAGAIDGVTAFSNEMTKKMENQQKQIDKMQKNLKKKEEAYYKQFTRLEVAMNKANSQMAYFSQQMG